MPQAPDGIPAAEDCHDKIHSSPYKMSESAEDHFN